MRLETIPELPGPGRDYKCLVLLLRTIQEKFGMGRDCSVPLGKFLNGLEMGIINSGIPVSFSGLRRDGKWASLERRELDGTGMGPVLNACDREFPAFSRKKIWYPKPRPGMQTSRGPAWSHLINNHYLMNWFKPFEKRTSQLFRSPLYIV